MGARRLAGRNSRRADGACRGQWFFGDEWDFILYRGPPPPDAGGCCAPTTSTGARCRFCGGAPPSACSALRTYWPYLFGLFATHLDRRALPCGDSCGAPASAPRSATGVRARAAACSAPARRTCTWAFQVGFVGSLAAGMLLLLLVDERRRPATGRARRRRAPWSSLMLSGISVVMVGRRRARRARALGVAQGACRDRARRRSCTSCGCSFKATSGSKARTRSITAAPATSRATCGVASRRRSGAPFKSDRVGRSAARRVPRRRGVARPRLVATGARVVCALAAASAGDVRRDLARPRRDPGAPRPARYLYLCAGMLVPLIAFAVQQVVDARRRASPVALVACARCWSSLGADELFQNVHYDRDNDLTLQRPDAGVARRFRRPNPS